ncbi:MAG: HDOD domain-containing protein [Bythopirellula sp.]
MTRILFVDDEPKLLDGLRSMLRAYRRDWTMDFRESAEQALIALDETPYDAIVTDLCMPGVDGAELLTRVRDKYPDTIRIVLSGQSEEERILRAVGPAHQYLSKPCDPAILKQAITRACLLGKRTNNPQLRSLVSRLDSLPSLPDIYFDLVEELRNEDSSVDRVGALISRDIGMTAKVLQLVNSSFFGLPVHVNDAKHAAALLGLNTLKPLVLTASIFRQLEESRVSQAFLEQVLAHSMIVAGIAKQLASSAGLNREAIDNTFIAGALHDVGKVVLADNFGRDYTGLCHKAKAQSIEIATLETEAYNATHAEVGGFLLSLWGLPQDIIEAVAFHHDPATSVDDKFTALTAVHVANALIAESIDPTLDAEMDPPLDHTYLARLGLENRVEHWRSLAESCAEPA